MAVKALNKVLVVVAVVGLTVMAGDTMKEEKKASTAMAPQKHTNRLINESSPYLLQHAHNSVDWYPWDRKAFERAQKEDKPAL